MADLDPDFQALLSPPKPSQNTPQAAASIAPNPKSGLDPDFHELLSATAPAAASTAKPSGISDYLAAVPQAALALGSQMYAFPKEAAAGAVGMLRNGRAGMSQTAADIAKVQQDSTYTPPGAPGQALTDAINYLPGKFGQMSDAAGQGVTNLTGSAGLGAATDVAIQSLPVIGGMGARSLLKGAPKVATPTVSPAVTAATQAGLKLTPEQAGAGLIGRTAQSLSGSAKLERDVSKANAPVIDKLAASDIGIAGPLSDAAIQQAKVAPNAIYGQVAKAGPVTVDPQFRADIANVSNPGAGSFAFDVPPAIDKLKQGYGALSTFDAGDAVAKIRQLRASASGNIKAPMSPEQNSLGFAQRDVAAALDAQLDRHIQANASTLGLPPDLGSQYQAARVQLAKIHSVEDAFDGMHVVAGDLAKQAGKGVPLSGNLKTIADAYGNFDRSLQDTSKIRDSGPVGVLDRMLLGAAGLHHPGVAASILAAPATRAALASGPYQRAMVAPSLTMPRVPGLMTGLSTLPALQAQQRGLLQ